MSQNFNVKSETSNVKYQLYRSYGTSENDKKRNSNNSLDLLQLTIGDFGHWQCRISLLMSLLKFPIAWFQLGIVFLAPPTEFWCKRPDKYKHIPIDQWKLFIAPKANNCKLHQTILETGSCMMWDIGSDIENKSLVTRCQWGYEYNRSVIHSSIITEWDLICGRERLVDVAQITLMFGVLLGSIIFGAAADKFGRRKILLIAILLQSICGILSALSPWFLLFLLFRFILAMANGGTMITSFVMCMEVVGGVWRTVVPILYQIPFGLGNTIMAGIAYFLRDWRSLQFTLSVLSSVYIIYFCLIPESPRWLLAVGRKEEAIQILEKAAKTNGINSSQIKETVENQRLSRESTISMERPGLSALIKTDELKTRTILLCLNWFICGVSFFGFSQYLGQVSHNLYFAIAVGGLIAVPGTLLCVVVVTRCGRRRSIACACVFTAICFLSILAVPRGVFPQDWPRITLAGFGVVGMSVSLPALYLFTGELFPTVVRNAGLGSAVMCSKLGSMIAPLVISLGEIAWFIPLLVLGILSALEAVLVLPLPETLNTILPETIQDIEVVKLHPSKKKKENGDYGLVSNKIEEEHN